MKALEINTVCGTGSTGRICTDLAELLIARGDTCYVTHGREPVPEKYRPIAVRIGTDTDMRLHGVETRLFDAHGFGSRAATRRFLEWVKDYDPDLIHLHNIHGYYLNIELLFDYLKSAEKPVVWTLHDCWSFTGHCAHYTFANCDQWQSHCDTCRQYRSYPACLLFGNASRNFDRKRAAFTGVPNLTLVTPSQWLAGEVGKSCLREYPVQVIPNGIDLSVFRPTESDFRQQHALEGKTVLLGVANVWDERKGLADFVQLSKMLSAQEQLVLVGLTKQQITTLPNNILGLQRTSSVRELAELYTLADVFLNPTHEDNFPTTNLEALACGTPVITYRTGGSPESLDEKSGIVTDAAPEQMAAAIPAALSLHTEDCLRRAQQYDKNARFQRYLDLYGQKVERS